MAGRAEAADARLQISIPPRSYSDALIDLGVQANVSILGTASCGPGGRTELRGRYTLDQALARLLGGAPCRYRIVDSRTVRISAHAAPAVATPAREPALTTALVTEVVVTATKRPATMDSLPAGVSAISREQLSNAGAIEVGQTVGQLAGVLTTNLGPGRDKLLIRGLSDGAFTGRARSTVSTYLDDAPINYNAPDPDLRLVDVDRIEVVRGPQGALYGSGALAGIYRIVTRKPNLATAEFGASGSVSTTDGGDESYEIDGYVSLPLIRDRAAIRLVAYEDVQGGYLDDTNLQITNVDQTRRNGGRLALRVRLNDDWRFDALAATQNLRSDDTQYIIVDAPGTGRRPRMPMRDEPGGGAAPGDRANSVRETHNNDFSYVGGTIAGEFGWGSLSSSLSYVHHVFSSQYDASRAIGDIFAAPEEDLGVYTEGSRADMLVQDLVVRSNDGGRFDWLAGIYGSRTRERNPSSLAILSAGPVVSARYTEARKDRRRELAVYGEATYELSEGLSATLGGRLFESRVHTTADIDVVLANAGPRSFDRSRTFNGFSPKLSLQKAFGNGDLVYALVTEGYRPGGFNSSGFFEIRDNRALFAADRLRNYEVGAKLKRFDGRLVVRAAAYYDDWTNIQTDQYRPSGLSYTANVGDARILGLEAEVAYDFAFGFSLQLNGLISDSKTRNPNPDFPLLGAEVVAELPGVPKSSGGVLAVYQRPLTDALTLRLVGQVQYVGRADLGFDTSRSPRQSRYLRARLSAEVASDRWRLTVFVTNPTNSESDTFAYGNPFTFGLVRQVTPQRPRTVGARLGATF
ncbi:TonB-dependent receptor [uncultured Phenylobacterium sp.]|uniref:TonB-dependent receptor domain-containing protein n=1 Tax=uncultured Phenylobacterium sp. TaxID=349273 RepID=UPI0026012EDE|nr:TonB-dependent receptor [uncultured Phenylobacterium sp.]